MGLDNVQVRGKAVYASVSGISKRCCCSRVCIRTVVSSDRIRPIQLPRGFLTDAL